MVEDNLRTLALMNETGYQIQQDNGQRIFGPPPDWEGPSPKDTEVFIGKLPNDIYEYDLVPLFKSCGKIYMLRIMQNFSGLNRGFAFVQYSTPEEADRAISRLNNIEIRPGEKIGVVKSRNNCRLYIGKLDQTMTKEEIRSELEILTEDIIDVIIHKNETDGLNNRGYAFVEYLTHKAAAKARRKLVPCKIKIRGNEIQVDWATPSHESGDSLSIQTSLLIKNLRETCKNNELVYYYSLRNKFKIVKFKRLPTQALISFNSKQEAEFAMRIYNEIKNSQEFNYFSEKDKRVEIVWLKNTMDLTAFSSAVNYPIPRVFQAPVCSLKCCDSNHQHLSQPLPNQPKQIQLTGSVHQSPNGNTQQQQQQLNTKCCDGNISCTHRCVTPDCVHKCRSPAHQQVNKSLLSNDTNLAINKQNVDMKSPQLTNQRFFPPNNYQKINNAKFINNQSVNRSNYPQYPGQNNLANRFPYLNNGFNNNHLNSSMSNRRFGAPLLPEQPNHPKVNVRAPIVYQPMDKNPFSSNQFGLSKTNGFSWNGKNQLNAPPNSMPNGLPINDYNQLNSSKNSMMNSMNTSYNFGIWTNASNLDASANWNRFKDKKNFKSRNSVSSPENINEEDTYSIGSSMKSFESCTDKFNYFNPAQKVLYNPMNGLNLHENISNYPAFPTNYYPVLQQ